MSETTSTLALVQARTPADWKVEIWADRIVISNREGAITLDPDRRTFRWGMTIHGEAATTASFAGRGWRDRLVAAAIEALKKAQGGRKR